jgi:hypothetical protein
VLTPESGVSNAELPLGAPEATEPPRAGFLTLRWPKLQWRPLLVCFWVLFVLAPLSPIAVALAADGLSTVLPAWLQDVLPLGMRCLICGFGFLLGAAFCLAKLSGIHRWPELWPAVFGYTVFLLVAYFVIGGVLAGLWHCVAALLRLVLGSS